MSDAVDRLRAALTGRYRVERELGQGGMAIVYLAQDLRHHRRVALKVLRPELAAFVGAERFLAEIETTANLQHPHILPLFDSGEADGLLFYVMPHVEGESLADRLSRERQLPIDDAVQITTAVAEALDYAHARGVIHRDMKPANILLQAGTPVISDFGIAVAIDAVEAKRLTEAGVSLGTPQYMSPEQATGDLGVGVATDVYALGCVLYEMLLGEPPFTGSTPQAILGKILTAEPVSATKGRKSVPANVDGAIRRALERVPADRFASAGGLARALADPAYRYGPGARSDEAGQGPWNRLSVGLAVVAAVCLLTSAWSISALLRGKPGPLARFDVTPMEALRAVASSSGVDIALAPDGSSILYVAEAPGGGTQIWRRTLQDLEATAVPGTSGARSVTLSPDGLSLVFEAGGAIHTTALAGGPPLTVAAGGSPAWAQDGMIYFNRGGLIHRVSPAGGDPETVTAPSFNTTQLFPDGLPDGRGVVLTVFRGAPAESRIAVVGPEGGEVREILTGTMARYSPSGHIIYATVDGTLFGAPFDVRRLEVTGPSVPLAQGVTVVLNSAPRFALSASGTLLYGVGASPGAELVWVDRDGRVESVDPAWRAQFTSPALSPDGGRLAVSIQGEVSMDVWLKELDRGPSVKLTLDGSRNDNAAWTPDGQSVTFASNRAGPSFDLWTLRADGSAASVLLRDEERALAEASWSPDGEWLVYRTSTNGPGTGDILAIRRGGVDEPVPLASTEATEVAPAISPDGRWMAYSSNEDGVFDVFVVPLPDAAAAKWRVSVGGGTEPAWSHDTPELFYRNGRGDMVAVSVEPESAFAVGSPSVLFAAGEYFDNLVHRQYEVTADGRRFLLIRPGSVGSKPGLVLVQNFVEELRARARRPSVRAP